MPIHVEWLNEDKRVILRTLSDQWTWDDFYLSQQDINQMLNEVSYPVDEIIDASTSTTLPQGAISQFRRASEKTPDNLHLRLVVGSNSFYQLIFNILSKIIPHIKDRVVFVQTFEEAHTYLEKNQDKL